MTAEDFGFEVADISLVDPAQFLSSPPTCVNEHGEEIWEVQGINMALVRLKPGTRSECHFHIETKEWYFILEGLPTMELDGQVLNLHKGSVVKINPFQAHQIFNHSHQNVLFLVKSNIPWSIKDYYCVN